MTHKTRVVVGLSGGVDSSASAYLLQQQGYDVHGMFMKNWEDDDNSSHCTAAEDLADVKQVCDALQIPLHTVNFAAEYKASVFDHFLAEYKAGRTPNPDILCNREIKFKAFLDYAVKLGADFIATGHYVRRQDLAGKIQLLKGVDPGKDQSYFLHALNQAQLTKAIFPVGDLPKPAVRELAAKAGLHNFDRKDSTGICFIGERDFKPFLERYLPRKRGNIVTVEGEIVGQHDGLTYFTVGQRQGLGIGGKRGADASPWYVVDKNMVSNELIVCQGHDHPALFGDALLATDLHWIAGDAPDLPLRCSAKIRYRQTDQACTVTQIDDLQYRVEFATAQRAISPGQSVVFYAGDVCLGGGIIQSKI